jgi:hypothetical protein
VEWEEQAIYCHSEWCAALGETGCDIRVANNCNANSYTCIGTRWGDRTYANDTTFEDFITGAYSFTVKQIEVFEIA